ncbi:MAG TPA: nucleotidyltransferase family protein [Candidatus Acidoferrales bacterium]|nr:nucleotidyltransferase family protein [Candidatus Acidoferrales bacterium]
MNSRWTPAQLSPEWKFILAAARPRVNREVQQGDLEKCVAAVRDWEQVGALAEIHGVRPLCFDLLRQQNIGLIPQNWLDSLAKTVQILTRRSLALTAELFHLLDALEAASIPAIPYKGPVLAAQAFGDIARREYGDLDILVHHRDVAAVEELLLREGYRAAVPLNSLASSAVPGQFSYSRPGALPVEFHTEKTLRYYPVPFDIAWLERNLTRVSIGDRDVRTFAPEDSLTVLSVHGCKHLWSRLLWVADIAWLIHSSPDFNWDAAMECADRFRSRRMMLTGAGLAANLLETELPEKIHFQIGGDAAVQKLIAESCREIFAGPSAAGVLERALFRVRSVEGTVAGLRYLYRLTGSPAEDDWTGAKPGGISAAASRPLRLIRKYGLTRKRE